MKIRRIYKCVPEERGCSNEKCICFDELEHINPTELPMCGSTWEVTELVCSCGEKHTIRTEYFDA